MARRGSVDTDSETSDSEAFAIRVLAHLAPYLRDELRRLAPLAGSTKWSLVAETPAPEQPKSAGEERRPPDAYVFRDGGTVRILKFRGEDILCDNTVGCRYIAALLAQLRRAIAATDLKAAIDGNVPAVFSSDRVAAADSTALRSLERRFADLVLEQEEALRLGDVARQEAIRQEMDALAGNCRSILGRGGRARTSGDGERVRISVTNAIRRAIDLIERSGARRAVSYFDRTIRTGSLLSFCPEADEIWEVF